MKAIVKSHPETGAVITEGTSEKGNKYGKFRVEQVSFDSSQKGILNLKKRSAFITVFGDDIDTLKGILSDGMEYPVAGKIVRNETREPQYEGHAAKINPEKPGELFLVNGAQVYMTDEWSTDLSAQDTLILSNVEVAVALESEEEGQ
jgi:hypothetical protein